MEEVLSKVIDGIRGILPEVNGQVIPETTIADIPAWDSLHSVTFQMFLEETFKKKIPLDLLQGDSTVRDIVDFIEESNP